MEAFCPFHMTANFHQQFFIDKKNSMLYIFIYL